VPLPLARRRPGAVGVALLALALGVGTSACGGGVARTGDAQRGKELFVQKCASCHTLADAGARGTVGPNLDDVFRVVRAQGFDESSIRDIVAGQIRYPVSNTPTGAPGMPANLVTGDDVEAVASYVASVAGKAPAGGGGGGITATEGKKIFAQAGCGSCHTLADAGSTGTVGPNLDQAKPSVALAIDRVTNGKGVMPSFKGQLSSEQIRAVAEYVASAAGK